MKIKQTKKMLILLGAATLLAGCETGPGAASVSPGFPPAPLTKENSPQTDPAP